MPGDLVECVSFPTISLFWKPEPGAGGTGALTLGCVLPSYRARINLWDPGMQRLGGFAVQTQPEIPGYCGSCGNRQLGIHALPREKTEA